MTGPLYMLSENNFGSKSLRESSASCASLLQLRYSEVLKLRCSKHAKCCHFCKSCKFHSFFHPLKLLQGSLVPLAIFFVLERTMYLDHFLALCDNLTRSTISTRRLLNMKLAFNQKVIPWQKWKKIKWQCRWTYFLHFFFNLANLDRGQTELIFVFAKRWWKSTETIPP